MMRSLYLACLALLLASCLPTGPSERDDLRRNLERWQARQPTTHEFVFRRYGCECLPEWTTPMQIVVHDREIRSVADLQTGESVSAELYRAMSIDELFVVIERALEQDAARVVVTYDREFGYPTSIFIDGHHEMVDDEVSYSVQALRAVP